MTNVMADTNWQLWAIILSSNQRASELASRNFVTRTSARGLTRVRTLGLHANIRRPALASTVCFARRPTRALLWPAKCRPLDLFVVRAGEFFLFLSVCKQQLNWRAPLIIFIVRLVGRARSRQEVGNFPRRQRPAAAAKHEKEKNTNGDVDLLANFGPIIWHSVGQSLCVGARSAAGWPAATLIRCGR